MPKTIQPVSADDAADAVSIALGLVEHAVELETQAGAPGAVGIVTLRFLARHHRARAALYFTEAARLVVTEQAARG